MATDKPSPKEIREMRARKGLTQTEAADAVGVTERAWRYWEYGEREISPSAWRLFQTIKPRRPKGG